MLYGVGERGDTIVVVVVVVVVVVGGGGGGWWWMFASGGEVVDQIRSAGAGSRLNAPCEHTQRERNRKCLKR